jgi:hypothetical protein
VGVGPAGAALKVAAIITSYGGMGLKARTVCGIVVDEPMV